MPLRNYTTITVPSHYSTMCTWYSVDPYRIIGYSWFTILLVPEYILLYYSYFGIAPARITYYICDLGIKSGLGSSLIIYHLFLILYFWILFEIILLGGFSGVFIIIFTANFWSAVHDRHLLTIIVRYSILILVWWK